MDFNEIDFRAIENELKEIYENNFHKGTDLYNIHKLIIEHSAKAVTDGLKLYHQQLQAAFEGESDQ